jgi:hypothetical protein
MPRREDPPPSHGSILVGARDREEFRHIVDQHIGSVPPQNRHGAQRENATSIQTQDGIYVYVRIRERSSLTGEIDIAPSILDSMTRSAMVVGILGWWTPREIQHIRMSGALPPNINICATHRVDMNGPYGRLWITYTNRRDTESTMTIGTAGTEIVRETTANGVSDLYTEIGEYITRRWNMRVPAWLREGYTWNDSSDQADAMAMSFAAANHLTQQSTPPIVSGTITQIHNEITTMPEQPLHSEIGGSTCERAIACPGSVALIRAIRQQGHTPATSVYAAEGTVAHLVAEAMVRSEVFGDNAMIDTLKLGTLVTTDGHDIEIDDEMYDGAYVYAEVVQDIKNRYSLQNEMIGLEAQVRIPATNNMNIELFGKTDFRIIIPFDRIVVGDYKYGKGKRVQVENNTQLKYYALGVYLSLEEAIRETISTIEMVVIQPRLPGDTKGVTTICITSEELLAFHQELLAAVLAVTPDAPRRAGAHCANTFCPARANCAEAQAHAVQIAQVDFVNVQLPSVVNERQLPVPSEMTGEQLAKISENWEYLESYKEQCMLELQRRLEADRNSVPRHKLVAKRANRKWRSEAEIIEKFQGQDFIYEKKLLSPAKLEKIVGKGNVEEYTIKPDNGLTVAHASDRRPAVEISAAHDFRDTEVDGYLMDMI